MQPVAVRIIREEHSAMAAVLYSLRYLVRKIGEGDKPDFRLLHAMLDYVVEYPERWHHPKENDYLFATLRERSKEAVPVIEALEAEHVRGDRMVKELTRALIRYEKGGVAEYSAFAAAVEAFDDFHWKHMRKEEEVLLPLAEQSLTETDWRKIGDAFLENDNPLFGLKPKEMSEELFQRILTLAPPPLGVGAEKT